jgi:hypothetical protein
MLIEGAVRGARLDAGKQEADCNHTAIMCPDSPLTASQMDGVSERQGHHEHLNAPEHDAPWETGALFDLELGREGTGASSKITAKARALLFDFRVQGAARRSLPIP